MRLPSRLVCDQSNMPAHIPCALHTLWYMGLWEGPEWCQEILCSLRNLTPKLTFRSSAEILAALAVLYSSFFVHETLLSAAR